MYVATRILCSALFSQLLQLAWSIWSRRLHESKPGRETWTMPYMHECIKAVNMRKHFHRRLCLPPYNIRNHIHNKNHLVKDPKPKCCVICHPSSTSTSLHAHSRNDKSTERSLSRRQRPDKYPSHGHGPLTPGGGGGSKATLFDVIPSPAPKVCYVRTDSTILHTRHNSLPLTWPSRLEAS